MSITKNRKAKETPTRCDSTNPTTRKSVGVNSGQSPQILYVAFKPSPTTFFHIHIIFLSTYTLNINHPPHLHISK